MEQKISCSQDSTDVPNALSPLTDICSFQMFMENVQEQIK